MSIKRHGRELYSVNMNKAAMDGEVGRYSPERRKENKSKAANSLPVALPRPSTVV